MAHAWWNLHDEVTVYIGKSSAQVERILADGIAGADVSGLSTASTAELRATQQQKDERIFAYPWPLFENAAQFAAHTHKDGGEYPKQLREQQEAQTGLPIAPRYADSEPVVIECDVSRDRFSEEDQQNMLDIVKQEATAHPKDSDDYFRALRSATGAAFGRGGEIAFKDDISAKQITYIHYPQRQRSYNVRQQQWEELRLPEDNMAQHRLAERHQEVVAAFSTVQLADHEGRIQPPPHKETSRSG